MSFLTLPLRSSCRYSEKIAVAGVYFWLRDLSSGVCQPHGAILGHRRSQIAKVKRSFKHGQAFPLGLDWPDKRSDT